MELKYDRLWFRLAEKGMKKKDLQALTGLSSATISKLSHNQSVSTKTLEKICQSLECDINEIVDSETGASVKPVSADAVYGMNSFFSRVFVLTL